LISWVPDTLTRETHKESIRVKMLGVGIGGKLRADACRGATVFIQANSFEQVTLSEVIARATKNELDRVKSLV